MPELAHSAGEVVSYLEMCQGWSASLQRGMNFRLRPDCSVILMSRRANAPYRDRIEEDGRVLIYEGHDIPRSSKLLSPKVVDQPAVTPGGKLTQNGMFAKAAEKAKSGSALPELVAVYEKIHAELSEDAETVHTTSSDEPIHNRLIPSAVKLEVWKRDKGRCVLCGGQRNLHFDHDLPFSKGGSSLLAANIRLLCAKHNLLKGAKIE